MRNNWDNSSWTPTVLSKVPLVQLAGGWGSYIGKVAFGHDDGQKDADIKGESILS